MRKYRNNNLERVLYSQAGLRCIFWFGQLPVILCKSFNLSVPYIKTKKFSINHIGLW